MFPAISNGRLLVMVAVLALLPASSVFAAEGRHESLDAMLRELHARDLFHGAIVVSDAGVVVYETGFGLANREESVSFTPDTPNDTGSIAKTITAALVWKLHEDGRLSIDDLVQKHLPAFPYPTITVRHLLAHSSGLLHYDYFEKIWEPGTVWANERILETLAELRPKLAFEPGTEFAYSSPGYDIAALVVGATSGMTFDKFARDTVLAPLGMRTAFVRPAMFADWPGTRTRGYRLRDGEWEPHDASEAEGVVGGGNFSLSARDLHRWSTAFLESPVLAPETLAVGMRPAVIAGRVSGLSLLNWYGSADGNEAWYAGEHRGFSTRIYRNHAKRRSIAFTCNNTPPQWLIPALIRAVNAVLDGASPEPLVQPEIRQVPRSERDAIAGTYALRDGRVAIENTGGTLHVTFESGVRYRAFAVGGGIFYVPGLELWFWFTADLELVASRVTGIEKTQRHR